MAALGIVTQELSDVLADAAPADNIPSALFQLVMDKPELNGQHVAQLHRLAEHMELCIRARDAWRGL